MKKSRRGEHMRESYVIIYIIGAIIAAMIIGKSVVFLVKAIKRAKAIGMDKKSITETVKNSAIFSIVPSIPIVVGIGIMMPYLGLAIPWIRLTVIGALQYEVSAAFAAGAMSNTATTSQIVTAIIVMTLSIISGPLFNAIFYKKFQNKLASIQEKNKHKMDSITGALLAGMLAGIISALIVGGAFGVGAPITDTSGITTYGEITLITLSTSVIIMLICGAIMILGKQKWIESYALPISILGSLLVALAFVPVFAA